MAQTNGKKARKEVFTICDRGEGKKDYWLRIGTAFVNQDGSLNVLLDALPVNGTLHIRDPKEKTDAGEPEKAE